MKFSIIVPVWNVEAWLPDLLKALEAQTCRDFEVIFVDDESPDQSAGLLQEACQKAAERSAASSDRACYRLVSQKNAGAGAARNHGLCEAQGEWVLFWDSDDIPEAAALERLSGELEKYTNAEKQLDVLFYGYTLCEADGSTKSSWIPETGSSADDSDGSRYERLFLETSAPWNKAYRRSYLLEKKLEFAEGLWYEDLAFYLRLLLSRPHWAVLPEPLYRYRLRPASTMNSGVSPKTRDIHAVLELLEKEAEASGQAISLALPLEAAYAYHGWLSPLTRLIRAGAPDSELRRYNKWAREHCPHALRNKLLSPRQRLLGRLYQTGFWWLPRLLLKESAKAQREASSQAK